MRTFCAQSRAYDNDVIQLFWPFADFTQPIKLQKTLGWTPSTLTLSLRGGQKGAGGVQEPQGCFLAKTL